VTYVHETTIFNTYVDCAFWQIVFISTNFTKMCSLKYFYNTKVGVHYWTDAHLELSVLQSLCIPYTLLESNLLLLVLVLVLARLAQS
jgi:hypothetical protein